MNKEIKEILDSIKFHMEKLEKAIDEDEGDYAINKYVSFDAVKFYLTHLEDKLNE